MNFPSHYKHYSQQTQIYTDTTHDIDRHDPHINTRRTETLSHSFIHKAPALWYTVPAQIKNVKTVGSFRSKIKRELLNK